MSGVQKEVRLFERQLIGTDTAPLLQYLVSDGPHQDRGVVTVPQEQVRQVPFVTLVKETGVVIPGLPTTPHVKLSSITMNPISSHRSSSSGAGGL